MSRWFRQRTIERFIAGAFLAALALITCAGCNNAHSASSGKPAPAAPAPDVSDDELRDTLDEVLQWTYDNRHLSLQQHAAWQILHGALAYKRDFRVDHNGQLVSAVDHLLAGGQMTGFVAQPGVIVDTATGQRGLQALMHEGSKTGQGHADQWLAVLSQCDLAPDQTIIVQGVEYTMADYVAQAQFDVPRNADREYSWTLIGLTTYLPTTATWTASDEKEWNIEQLVAIEAEQDLSVSACGGTHRLIGLSMALNRHIKQQGPELTGGWKQADDKIKKAINDARQFQNADGSFSANYFQRPGSSPDLAQNLGTTGHILEFLTLSLTDEQLQEPWVKRAVINMCNLLQATKSVDLECGALYHAVHGLVLYRERVYGPRRYAQDAVEPSQEAVKEDRDA